MKKHPAQPPRSMDMNVVRQIFGERIHGNPKICLTNDYAISTGIDFIGRILAVGDSGPYRLEDYRMGLLLRGEIHATVAFIMLYCGQDFCASRAASSCGQLSAKADMEGKTRWAPSSARALGGSGPVLTATVNIWAATAERTPRGAFSTTMASQGWRPARLRAIR